VNLGGWQKTTLIDFPGKVATTVFTIGCNFRCPFCHNKDLITAARFKKSKQPFLPEKEFFEFLEKRKKIIDGVCITGGEPTLQSDLENFCRMIKKYRLLVKLDTNGSRPQVLEKLLGKKLVDFVAMDFKTSWGNYSRVTGFKPVGKVKESLRLLLSSPVPLEVRTTIVPRLHSQETLLVMAKELKELVREAGRRGIVWRWQDFHSQSTLDPQLEGEEPYSEKEMTKLVEAATKIIPVYRP